MVRGRKQITEGCWTCRIRRKRCDSARPVCGNCQSLQITCHFSRERPAWMDGAAEQKRMMQTIKSDIKQNSLRRRERKHLESQDHGVVFVVARDSRTGSASGSASQCLLTARTDTASTPAGGVGAAVMSAPIESMETDERSSESTERSRTPPLVAGEFPRATVAIPTSKHPIKFPSRGSRAASLNLGGQVELGFVMIYLDHVFPFLFPFYQPPLLETGRHWLLSLLCQNEVSFYTAASLSSYFFSVVQEIQQEHKSCKDIVHGQLIGQLDKAFSTIQQDISGVNRSGVHASLTENFHVLIEIIQLLIVEVTVRRNPDWTIHLTPALHLFEHILNHYGTSSSQPNLAVLLRQLPPPPYGMASKPFPNTADQSAMLFFIATLLFIDIVSSTVLQQAPRLQVYHASLLRNDQIAETQISMENFVGCQSWVLLLISKISTLDAWKKNAKYTGLFSVVELVNLARPISEALDEGLDHMDSSMLTEHPMMTAASHLGGYYARFERRTSSETLIATSTRVWAYAAKIYLSIILSGWQPACPDIRDSVSKTLTLLERIKSPAQLRSLAWPLCVAGCLALPQQEQKVCHIIEIMGKLSVFGTVKVAQGIVEAVWKSRDTLDRDAWDIAACLRVLGSPALLI